MFCFDFTQKSVFTIYIFSKSTKDCVPFYLRMLFDAEPSELVEISIRVFETENEKKQCALSALVIFWIFLYYDTAHRALIFTVISNGVINVYNPGSVSGLWSIGGPFPRICDGLCP